MSQMRPFRRLPFARLPETPTRPHPYFDTAAREIVIASKHFGRINVHYREHGSGPPLLLIHGLMTSSYSWRYVLEGLGARFRLIIPDLPGAGRTDKPAAPMTPEAITAFLGELQDALGLRGCAAVGNSLGGYFCMRRALVDPGAFSRLVNVHSPAFPIARLRALHAVLALPGTRRLVGWWARRNPERWAHKNVHYYDESLKSLEEAREFGAPLSTVEGARAFVSWLADSLDPGAFGRFVAELEGRRAAGTRFPIPLLLLYARQDPMVPPVMGERLSALLDGVDLVWLDQSSHFAHVDSPERVVPILLDFLSRPSDRPRPAIGAPGAAPA
jgi:pimeloyl-ACP methyl ester carboxylesterase